MVEPDSDSKGPGDYESTPLNRSEYIAAIVHLYRGELYRANSWRIRLDNTTNWAVLTTAGILSISFSGKENTHWILLMGMGLIAVFLAFEARRYRFADIWYTRVRKIEENFYGPILRRDPTSPEAEWGKLLSEELFRPRFKIGRMASVRARLLHNYWAIYGVLLLCWVLKIIVNVENWADVKDHLAEGVLPWWVPFAYLSTLLGSLLAIVLFAPRPPQDDPDRWTFTP